MMTSQISKFADSLQIQESKHLEKETHFFLVLNCLSVSDHFVGLALKGLILAHKWLFQHQKYICHWIYLKCGC